jgi:3-deoxy-D-manno-octulosonic-acid transferase
MMFPIYTMAYTGLAAVASPYYLLRGLRSGKYWWSLQERLGRGAAIEPVDDRPIVWVHALSLGEMTSSLGLVEAIDRAGYSPVISATTRSGYDLAVAKLPSIPRIIFPFDFPASVRRTIKRVNPDVMVVVETDIWPNMLAGLKKSRVPAVLVNARLSPRSYRGYRLVKGLWGRVLNLFEAIGCQTEADKERFRELGAPMDRLIVTGNLKYDHPRPETGPEIRVRLLSEAGLSEGLWLVAGSTHQGEEEILLNMTARLRNDFPDLKLLLAPRNKDRFDSVWRMAEKKGLPAIRRSKPDSSIDPAVFVLDTLGELGQFYELGDVVFVGKSLPVGGEGGGHNLLEPAMRGRPVLFGPRMHNFPEIADIMIRSGGGRQVADGRELEIAMRELLENPNQRNKMGQNAMAEVEKHRGARARNLDLIARALDARKRRNIG